MAAKFRLGAALALIALCGAACSNIETPDFEADAAGIMADFEARTTAKWRPIPLRVGVAPMRAALEFKPEEFNKEGTRRWVLPADEEYMNGAGDGLNARLIGAMTTDPHRMFESVKRISFATPETTPDELLRLALNQGFDVVLQPTIRRHDVRYVDSNGAYGWNMFVWWMVSPIISWFIADEDFEISLHLDLRFMPVTQNRELAFTKLKPEPEIVRSLDDFDQGFNLFSIYSTPGYLDEDNWKLIGDALRPIAENELKKALLRYVTGPLYNEAGGRKFRDLVRKRAALIVGVDGASPLPPSFADDDAEDLEAHLLRAENLPVPEGALRKLVGSRATREAILTGADELAALARANDDVLLALCGAGTVDEKDRPALVLSRGQGGQLIAVEDVVDRLMAGKPRSVTLLLDCSFTAPGDRRCVLSEERLNQLHAAHKGKSLLDPIRQKIEAAGVKCVILAASDAVAGNPHGMKALEIDELANGLFTSFALDAMQGAKVDVDGNGLVSFDEFESYVKDKVTHVAGLERENQTGYFYITQDFRADFALPTGRRQP